MPTIKPVTTIAMPIDTTTKARNGLTLAMATIATSAVIAVATIRMVMACDSSSRHSGLVHHVGLLT
jgi:hypothetical protein